MTTLTSAPSDTFCFAARKLRGITPDQVDAVTADFNAADWCRLSEEHLNHIGMHMFPGLRDFGIDMDDDPIAVFCLLYLKARSANHYPRCLIEHPEYHADEAVLR